MARDTFELEPVSPFRLDLTVWTLRRRPSNVVDRWDGTTYRRVLPLPAGPVEVAVTQVAPPEAARLKVAVAGQPVSAAVRVAVTTALERLLGLRIDLTEFYQFAMHHRQLGSLVQRFRGMKPPRFATGFEGVINAMACQQLTLTLGVHLLNRLAVAFGTMFGEGNEAVHAFPRPMDLAGISPAAMRQFGFSRQKGLAIIELAQSVTEGRLDLEVLATLSDDEAVKRFRELRGVGWLRLTKPLDYSGVARVLSRWDGYAGLVYFHLLLDRLAAAGHLGEINASSATRRRTGS
jgi:DNA-3-methyladenine glycosylase II